MHQLYSRARKPYVALEIFTETVYLFVHNQFKSNKIIPKSTSNQFHSCNLSRINKVIIKCMRDDKPTTSQRS